MKNSNTIQCNTKSQMQEQNRVVHAYLLCYRYFWIMICQEWFQNLVKKERKICDMQITEQTQTYISTVNSWYNTPIYILVTMVIWEQAELSHTMVNCHSVQCQFLQSLFYSESDPIICLCLVDLFPMKSNPPFHLHLLFTLSYCQDI